MKDAFQISHFYKTSSIFAPGCEALCYYRFNTIKGVKNDRQVVQLWAAASVWRCALPSQAGSILTALPGSSGCLICSLHAERLPIWPRATDRLALCVSSPQDCQKSFVKSPSWLGLQARRKLTRRREREALFMLQHHYFFTKKEKKNTRWSLPVVILYSEEQHRGAK